VTFAKNARGSLFAQSRGPTASGVQLRWRRANRFSTVSLSKSVATSTNSDLSTLSNVFMLTTAYRELSIRHVTMGITACLANMEIRGLRPESISGSLVFVGNQLTEPAIRMRRPNAPMLLTMVAATRANGDSRTGHRPVQRETNVPTMTAPINAPVIVHRTCLACFRLASERHDDVTRMPGGFPKWRTPPLSTTDNFSNARKSGLRLRPSARAHNWAVASDATVKLITGAVRKDGIRQGGWAVSCSTRPASLTR